MTAPDENPDPRIASYVRAYVETDETFADIVTHLDMEMCPDPDEHSRWFSQSETTIRLRAAGQLEQRVPGLCSWCGKTTYEPGGTP